MELLLVPMTEEMLVNLKAPKMEKMMVMMTDFVLDLLVNLKEQQLDLK